MVVGTSPSAPSELSATCTFHVPDWKVYAALRQRWCSGNRPEMYRPVDRNIFGVLPGLDLKITSSDSSRLWPEETV